MKLEDKFEIPVPVERAWPLLLDIERLAPCLPGATVTAVSGPEYTGRVKIKAGPITVSYAGRLLVSNVDELGRSLILDAVGKEQRGSGTVKAQIAAKLVSTGPTTSSVELNTDLAITGKPAQLGRGLIADVSAKIIAEFANNLARELSSATSTEGDDRPVGTRGPVSRDTSGTAQGKSLDLLPLLKPYARRGAVTLAAILLTTQVIRRLYSRLRR